MNRCLTSARFVRCSDGLFTYRIDILGFSLTHLLQLLAATGTIVIFVADGGITARTMSVLGLLFRLIDDIGCHNACGNSDDGVTQQHDEG